MAPIRLTDSQLDAVLAAARPLDVGNRDAFLQAIVDALQEPGEQHDLPVGKLQRIVMCAGLVLVYLPEPLVPFPLPSPARFSRSAREPSRGSRRLHAGCRSGGLMPSPELFPEDGSTPGSDIA
jgi:hypothetical protein